MLGEGAVPAAIADVKRERRNLRNTGSNGISHVHGEVRRGKTPKNTDEANDNNGNRRGRENPETNAETN